MEPKTAFHREILKCRSKLPTISLAQIRYVEDNLYKHFAYTTRHGISWCTRCGYSWKSENHLADSVCGTECPVCHEQLEYCSTDKRVFREGGYFTLMTVCQGHQVIRCFRVDLERRYRKPAAYKYTEVIQYWISRTGQTAVLSKKRVPFTYNDKWYNDSPMELRKYDCYKDYIRIALPYKRNIFLPELLRSGFDGNFHGVPPVKFISCLLYCSSYETLLKQGDTTTMKLLMDRVGKRIDRYWPSMKICRRHGYHIPDYTIWIDHIDLLRHFKKDIHSPKYICPEDLIKEHNRLVCKRNLEIEQEKIKKKVMEAYTHEDNYRKAKGKYFGLYFTDGTIEIKVLSSVADFVKEGTVLKHCVYANDYYQRSSSLILSARLTAEPDLPVETIEISLNTFEIIQSRGYKNSHSPYHESIISLMKSSIPQIRSIAA